MTLCKLVIQGMTKTSVSHRNCVTGCHEISLFHCFNFKQQVYSYLAAEFVAMNVIPHDKFKCKEMFPFSLA